MATKVGALQDVGAKLEALHRLLDGPEGKKLTQPQLVEFQAEMNTWFTEISEMRRKISVLTGDIGTTE